ncbi:MAG: hypothetical protein IPJ65_30450 [Archangiaceae bacterium]|nr:hypothetical protein [Archangiaceae bacterium]
MAFDGAAIGAGSLVLDGGFRRGFGLKLAAGLETSRTATVTQGSVSTWLSYAELLLRYTFWRDAWSFTPALGARATRTAAHATGFTSTAAEQVRYAPAAVAELEVRRALWRGLFVCATLAGYLRQAQALTIDGLGEPVAKLGAFGGSLALGAGWSFL